MRIAAALCLISAVVLAGCSSGRGRRVATQPRTATACRPAAVEVDASEPSIPTHERRIASFTPPAAPDLPADDATFVPASRPASAKSVRDPCDPCDPCSTPLKRLIRQVKCGPGG